MPPPGTERRSSGADAFGGRAARPAAAAAVAGRRVAEPAGALPRQVAEHGEQVGGVGFQRTQQPVLGGALFGVAEGAPLEAADGVDGLAGRRRRLVHHLHLHDVDGPLQVAHHRHRRFGHQFDAVVCRIQSHQVKDVSRKSGSVGGTLVVAEEGAGHPVGLADGHDADGEALGRRLSVGAPQQARHGFRQGAVAARHHHAVRVVHVLEQPPGLADGLRLHHADLPADQREPHVSPTQRRRARSRPQTFMPDRYSRGAQYSSNSFLAFLEREPGEGGGWRYRRSSVTLRWRPG